MSKMGPLGSVADFSTPAAFLWLRASSVYTTQKFDQSSSAQLKPFVRYSSERSVDAVAELLGLYVPRDRLVPLADQLTATFRLEQLGYEVPVQIPACEHEH